MLIVDIFFALLNFCLIIGIAVYGFRRYAYERIRQSMSFEQVYLLNMTKKNDLLRKQEQGLVRVYYHQNMVYEELSRKVDDWRQQREQEKLRSDAEDEKARETMTRRINERALYAQERQLLTEIQSMALMKAKEELEQWFRDPLHASNYTNVICTQLSGRKR